jgi:hypothetical protein
MTIIVDYNVFSHAVAPESPAFIAAIIAVSGFFI